MNRIVEVHEDFKLHDEVLHLCISIHDKFLAILEDLKKGELSLVMMASLLIASKLVETDEEITPLMCSLKMPGRYTKHDIIKMETRIAESLDYKLFVPTGYPFLIRFLHIVEASTFQRHAAAYYMELTKVYFHYRNFLFSEIAAGCVILSIADAYFLGPRTGHSKLVRKRCNRVWITVYILSRGIFLLGPDYKATGIYRPFRYHFTASDPDDPSHG